VPHALKCAARRVTPIAARSGARRGHLRERRAVGERDEADLLALGDDERALRQCKVGIWSRG